MDRASLATDSYELAAFAQRLLRRTLELPEPVRVLDNAWLCHGTTGLMHILSFAHQEGLGEEFGIEAARCAEFALAQFAAQHDPLRRLSRLSSQDEVLHLSDLNGGSGAMLALLTFANGGQPTWDACQGVARPAVASVAKWRS